MESKVKVLGHPTHPMFIVFPVGLFTTAVIFDIFFLIFGNQLLPTASFYMMAAGVIGGLIAAIFGLIDWLALPNNSRAKTIGGWHGIGNVIVVALFAGSWLVRNGSADFIPSVLALILSFAGAAVAMFTAWIGGELVYHLGVGIDNNANVNAPSSLSEKPASSPPATKRTAHR